MAGVDNAASIQACALRVTRLGDSGAPVPGSNALIQTDTVVSLGLTVVEDDGEEITVKSGCGNILYDYQEPTRFRRVDAELQMAHPDPEITELLTGGQLITANGQTIGYSAPAVGQDPHAGTCIELWSKAWLGGGPPPPASFNDGITENESTTFVSPAASFNASDIGRIVTGPGIPTGTSVASVTNSTTVVLSNPATAAATGIAWSISRPGRFWRWCLPKFVGSLADTTIENAAKENPFDGPCYENRAIGQGPFADWPVGMETFRTFHYFRDDTLPTPILPGFQELA